MAPTTPFTPANSTDTVNLDPVVVVVHQVITPPRTPPDQDSSLEELFSRGQDPNPTAAADAPGSAVSGQLHSKEIKTSEGKIIRIIRGGKLFE